MGTVSLLSTRLTERLWRLKTKRGLLIIIDEVQKIEQEHMVRICNATQMAKTSGLDIALVLGGLPLAYARVRSFKHCTFVRRMVCQRLWCMGVNETLGFFKSAFSRVIEIRISDHQIYGLGQFAGGHPHLMQLVGDNAYRIIREEFSPPAGISISADDAVLQEAMRRSLPAYRENVLDDVLVGFHPSTRQCIRLACQLRDPDTGLTRVADIDDRLDGSASAKYARRTNAIATQVIRPAGRGYVRLAMPHFEQYHRMPDDEGEQSLDDQWVYKGH